MQIALGVLALCLLVLLISFRVYYGRYERIVDERIQRPIFNRPAQIYAGGETLRIGDTWTGNDIAVDLRQAGYAPVSASRAPNEASPIGTYRVERGGTVRIDPGQASFHPGASAIVTLADGKVQTITDGNNGPLQAYELEPALVTGLFDAKERSKRRLLKFGEIPPVVINAIVSVEDRRFFEHRGINYGRLMEGLLTPLLRHRRMQGGSTLTMQMARSFFLTNERSAKRKLAEITIALILEKRFTKEQILELYVNQVDLGQQGSFDIRGFGEGAQAFFGKDIKSLTLPEAALLAGMVNGPSVFSPIHHPARAVARRNIVLRSMFENHVIDRAQLIAAEATPLKLAAPNLQSEDAPYFVDLVRERLLSKYSQSDLDNGNLRVYTSLDRQLQRVATDAIAVGMRQVDQAITRRRTHRVKHGTGKSATYTTETTSGPMPQVALIALDPHTGDVLALSGGRDYAMSQLDHAVARRPTGSIFKPFVYATALAAGLNGDPAQAFTQVSTLDASVGTFDDQGKPYTPHNFDTKDDLGTVTARYALAHSINTATVRLAQTVGYDKVVQLATAAGISGLQATPAMAIGAYDSTALTMAEAYTVFANGGMRMPPVFVRSVRNQDVGQMDVPDRAASANVLDPRVVSVITDMLGEVLNTGTAGGVRARFGAPAAGKTGSSHDAWFAGYSTNLLCVIWVGNDDYTDIKIEGAKAAAPIWAEFMARAQKLRRFHDMQPFVPVQGVIPVSLDKATNLPADSSCPDDYTAWFVDGTVPAATCGRPEGVSTTGNFFQKMFGLGHRELVLPPVSPGGSGFGQQPPNGSQAGGQQSPSSQPGGQVVPGQQQPNGGVPSAANGNATGAVSPLVPGKEKKHGFWHKLFGGKKDEPEQSAPPAQPQGQPGSTQPQPVQPQ